jgi:hypothetical protein
LREEPGLSNNFRKAGEILNSLFSDFNSEGLNQANSFLRSWKEIAGEKISAHSRVMDVDRGNVVVEVDHPGWSQQLLFRKKQIVNALARGYPELGIKNLVIRVSTECTVPYARASGSVGAGIPRAESNQDNSEPEIDVVVPENMNDELKQLFGKLKESIRKGKPS